MEEYFVFPDDILFEISRNYILSYQDIFTFSLVCKQFRRILRKYTVWKIFFERRYGKQKISPNTKKEDFRSLCLKEYQYDLDYDHSDDPIYEIVSMGIQQNFGNKDDHPFSKIIISNLEPGWAIGDIKSSSISYSPEGWFRDNNVIIVFASVSYGRWQHELLEGLFMVVNKQNQQHIYRIIQQKKKSHQLIIDFSEISCLEITENKENDPKSHPHNFSSILLRKYQQFVIDGMLSRHPKFLEKCIRFLLSVLNQESGTTHIAYAKTEVIKNRNQIFNRTKSSLSIEEMISFVLTEDELREQFRIKRDFPSKKSLVIGDSKRMISGSHKKSGHTTTQYTPIITKQHFGRRNKRGETKIQESQRKKLIVQCKDYPEMLKRRILGYLDVVKLEKKRYSQQKKKFDVFLRSYENKEGLLFSGSVIGMTKRTDCGNRGYRDDEIFEARLIITGSRMLIQKSSLMIFKDYSSPDS